MNELVEKQSKPDFAIVLDDLKNELEKLAENSICIFDKLCVIRNIREPQPEQGSAKQQPTEDGVVGELNSIIREIRRYNSILSDAKRGLVRFVG